MWAFDLANLAIASCTPTYASYTHQLFQISIVPLTFLYERSDALWLMVVHCRLRQRRRSKYWHFSPTTCCEGVRVVVRKGVVGKF